MDRNQQYDREEQEERIPVEQTNAYIAGYMAGYTKDSPATDPSIAGYMTGYLAQREGAEPSDD